MKLAEVREQLLRALPKGMRQRLGPDLLAFYEGIAQVLKTWCADVLDQLRREVSPLTVEQKIPDWEKAQGTAEGPIAKFGTPMQRRDQILARLREHGALSILDMQAAVQPFFKYADPRNIVIIEPDRAALKTAHTYSTTGAPWAIPNTFPPLVLSIKVIDDGQISEAGVQLEVNLTGRLEEISFALVGPDGASQQAFWPAGYLGSGAVTAQSFVLYAPTSLPFGVGASATTVRGSVGGAWTLRVLRTPASTTPATLHGVGLFAEGIGRAGKPVNTSPSITFGTGNGALTFRANRRNVSVEIRAGLGLSHVFIGNVLVITVLAGVTIADQVAADLALDPGVAAAVTVISGGAVLVLSPVPVTPLPYSEGFAQGLGAAMFEFQVVADPALLGTGYDLVAADLQVQRVKAAHLLGHVLQKSNVMGGGNLAIPDTPSAIPDAGIPG